MKDEIKEIINDLQRVADRKCYPEDILDGSIAQEWVDYITNLQEENTIKDTNWESLKYYLEKLYYKDYIEEPIFDDIDKKIKELESKVEIKDYQKEIKQLQEENKRLKELCDKYEEEHSSEFKIWKDERQQLRDYKSRNEKAIEYFKYQLEQLDFYEDTKAKMLCAMGIVILQGEDKDE